MSASDLMRSRIRERLNALGITVFEAERRAGFKRGYVNDLLIGKKDSLREKQVRPLAKALECEADYLQGLQASPTPTQQAGSAISGVIEADAWRPAGAHSGLDQPYPIPLDGRHDAQKLRHYLVRGDHAAGFGVSDGSIVTVLTIKEPSRDGDLVLARRVAPGGMQELSIRKVGGGALSAAPLKGEIAAFPITEAVVLGRIVSAIRLF